MINKLVKCNICYNIIKYKIINDDVIKKKCSCLKLCKFCGQIKRKKSYAQNNMYIKFMICEHCDVTKCLKCGKHNVGCICNIYKMCEMYNNDGSYLVKY